MSIITRNTPIELFDHLINNDGNIFDSLSVAIEMEKNDDPSFDDQGNMICEVVVPFIKAVGASRPDIILDSRRENGDNILHFILAKSFLGYDKVLDEILKIAPELIASRGANAKTPLHIATDGRYLWPNQSIFRSLPC